MTRGERENNANSEKYARGLTRSSFLRRSALAGASALGAGTLLAGCGSSEEAAQQSGNGSGGDGGFPGSPEWEAAVRENLNVQNLSVGFTPPILSEFFDEIEHACWRQMSELERRFGFQWEWARAAPEGFNAVEGHLSIIEDWVTKEFDAILICTAGDFASMQDIYENAQSQGTMIFQFNMPVGLWPLEELAAVSSIGYDEARQAGFAAGMYIADRLGGEGTVLQIWGPPGNHWSARRQEGFDQALAQNPGLEVVGKQNGGYVRDQAFEATQNLLQRFPDVDAIYGENEEMALGASQAINAQGSLKVREEGDEGIVVIGADGLVSGFEAIKAGQLTATVDVGPVDQGLQSIEAIFNYLARGMRIDRIINVPTRVVDRTNVEPSLAYVQWALDGPEY